MFNNIRNNRGLAQALFLMAFSVVIWRMAIQFDAFDVLDELVHEHESWEMDEILLALIVAGLSGLVFCLLRFRDLSAEIKRRNKAERDVEWIARHDPLTRLPNRRGLEKVLTEVEKSNGEGKRIAVYSIDLNGFKKLNDLFGHQAGDEGLIEVASRLKAIFPTDQVFRLGGDEFVVLQVQGKTMDVDATSSRVLGLLSRPYSVQGSTAEMSASVGVALYPDHASDPKLVVQYSDMAMYVAKREHRDTAAHFDLSMSAAMGKRHHMEVELRLALKAGTIVPHFQPLIDLKSGSVRGFEALARWTRTDGSSIPPSEFIPLAEETGLITELTEQLLRQACKAARSWPGNVRLAFNISPAQLTDKLLGLRVLRILGETGLRPDRLELEITESALVKDVELAEIVLTDLIEAGVHIALDDFGTGYSSLSQLSKFQFDKIKIDQSFVRAFETEAKQDKIVRAIIGLGQGLGLATTAEGIETADQAEILTAMGCDQGQGYYFGKAMAEADVLKLLRTSSDMPYAI